MVLFPTTGHTLIRYPLGEYIDGVWTVGDPTETPLIADIQPMSGEEVQTLAIGDNNIGKIWVFSNEALFVSDEGSDRQGDRVIYAENGETYEIIQEKPYGTLIPHLKYVGELRKNDNR